MSHARLAVILVAGNTPVSNVDLSLSVSIWSTKKTKRKPWGDRISRPFELSAVTSCATEDAAQSQVANGMPSSSGGRARSPNRRFMLWTFIAIANSDTHTLLARDAIQCNVSNTVQMIRAPSA